MTQEQHIGALLIDAGKRLKAEYDATIATASAIADKPALTAYHKERAARLLRVLSAIRTAYAELAAL